MSGSPQDGRVGTTDNALRLLELGLDSMSFRSARWLWEAMRRGRGLLRPSAPQFAVLAQVGKLATPPAKSLRHAMEVGALESAAVLAKDLAERDSGWLGEPSAQALLVEALLMAGERERAAAIARRYQGSLSSLRRGRTILALLGLGAPSDWVDPRHPNFVGLARRLDRGEAGIEDLVSAFPLPAWIFAPELNLLFFSALQAREPERASRFLSRYLALFGLPRCRLRCDAATGTSLLERLAFEKPPAVVGSRLVSVVVAAHDARPTVAFAIDSLLQQSYAPLEVLVGDDGSSDGTIDLLRARYAGEPRVRLFRSTKNQGAYNLRNALIASSRGQLITFHDADDVALPTRIAAQVGELQSPNAMGCVTNLIRVTPDGRVVFFKDQRASRLARVSLMLKREAFDAVGPFRSVRVGGDLELYAALVDRYGASAVRRLAAPHLIGTWAPGSATRADGTESLEDGYRSPLRRAYSELVYLTHSRGSTPELDAEIEQRLRAMGNYAAPSPIAAVGA